MTIKHQNNTINAFPSHNPMKRGITHALALLCNNHIFAYLTLKMTFDLEENLESWKKKIHLLVLITCKRGIALVPIFTSCKLIFDLEINL